MAVSAESLFVQDVTEFYRTHNPAKVGDVPGILSDARAKGISDDDVFASLCRKYKVQQFADRTEVIQRLTAAVPEAGADEIASSVRMAELRQLAERDAQRALERKFKKGGARSRANSDVGAPSQPQSQSQPQSLTEPQPAKQLRHVPADSQPQPHPSAHGNEAAAPDARGGSASEVPPSPLRNRAHSLVKAADRGSIDKVMAEEVREWLINTLGDACDAPVKSELNVVDALRDGVVLQLLLQKLRQPTIAVADIKRPKSSGFHARDNVSRFIRAIQSEFDVRTEVLFDDVDLVDGKNDRAVVSCLLTLAKIAYHRGATAAPAIVRHEEEIDARQRALDESTVEAAVEAAMRTTDEEGGAEEEEEEKVQAVEPAPADVIQATDAAAPPLAAQDEQQPQSEAAPEVTSEAESPVRQRSAEIATPQGTPERQMAPAAEPPSCVVSESAAPSSPELVILPPKRAMKARPGDAVDERVCNAFCKVLQKNAHSQTRLTRLGNAGEYVVYHRITGKRTVVFVRIVQKSLLIRVGGGWADFEEWLSCHMVNVETAPAGTMQRLNQKEALNRAKK